MSGGPLRLGHLRARLTLHCGMRALRPTFLTALLITLTACGGATPPPTESTATESAATESAAADLPTQAEIDAVALAGARNMCPSLVACSNAEYGDLAACEARWVEETVSAWTTTTAS